MSSAPIEKRSGFASRGLTAVLVATTVMTTAAVAYGIHRGGANADKLDRFGQLPPLSLTDQTGAPFTSAVMNQRVAIVNFVFTRCTTVCPVITRTMKGISDQLVDLGDDIWLVSISVDPEHDTPEVLGEFAGRYGADPARWRFVTGSADHIKSTVQGSFKVAMEREGEDPNGVPNIIHGSHFVLVDRDGTIRGYYDTEHASRRDELLRHARLLVNQDS